jgi:hypothetical protein
MNYPIFSNEWLHQVVGFNGGSGNSVVDYHEKHENDGVPHTDTYTCSTCKCTHIPEKEWVASHKVCSDCWADFEQEQICRHREE